MVVEIFKKKIQAVDEMILKACAVKALFNRYY